MSITLNQASLRKSVTSSLLLDGPHLLAPTSLRDAQHVVAREYGFDSWVNLRRHVEEATGTPLPRSEVATSLAVYEKEAVDRLDTPTASLESARHEVARHHGFRTWWRLIAAVDEARKSAVATRPFPTDADWDFKKEARDLAREARRGSPGHLQRFRAALLHLAERPDDALMEAVDPRQARYVLEVEYGGRQLNPRQTPTQRREWMERVWQGHDGSSRRKRAEMSSREQAFVEAATGDSRLPDEPDVPPIRTDFPDLGTLGKEV